MLPKLPSSWRERLHDVTGQTWWRELDAFLDTEEAAGREILPARKDIFNALRLTPPDTVKVVLLGQDPYPTPGHAHGLCFSVPTDVQPLPRSLRNIYRELHTDLGLPPAGHGCLETWARHGILMLNTVLTVRAGEANSHKNRGWETFTDRVLETINTAPRPAVFVLWGRQAQTKRARVTNPLHRVVECAHPSPLSARLFFGCRCFSTVNRLLAEAGREPVDWRLPPAPVFRKGELFADSDA
ncbi:MAG: uracil-DNA glycosylase [Opitutaceae bacterium]|jgi:uracil-DNA glycosylase|nr:uracil-DNA glycosylase [Opitutaceae bacterium]